MTVEIPRSLPPKSLFGKAISQYTVAVLKAHKGTGDVDERHTAATMLLRQKVNVKVVSEMLGHADISITLRIYAHVIPDMQQEAANRMDDVFGMNEDI